MKAIIKATVLWLYDIYQWADDQECSLWQQAGCPLAQDAWNCREKVQRLINMLED